MGLCVGRHEIPEVTSNIFNKEIRDVTDTKLLKGIAFSAIWGTCRSAGLTEQAEDGEAGGVCDFP